MATLRLGFRVCACAVLTCGWFAVFCAGLVVAWPFGRRLGWRDHVLHWWARSIVRALSIRVRASGPVPEGGFLVVSNHLSYVDVLVFAAQRPLSFLSKADVARWPVIGWMAWALGVQFIEREDKRSLPEVAARLAREIEAGHCVLIFPEGTSGDGEDVLPFRPALLAIAAAGRLPVSHAALRYRTPEGSPPARDAVCWWGDMTFGPHVLGLMRLPWIGAELRFGDAPVVARDRKVLARRLRDGVRADLERMGRDARG